MGKFLLIDDLWTPFSGMSKGVSHNLHLRSRKTIAFSGLVAERVTMNIAQPTACITRVGKSKQTDFDSEFHKIT